MPATPTRPTGRVYLVGAGPGKPDLITLRGIECLRRADVIIHDYLVNAEILKHAPATAARICLGGRGSSLAWSQEMLNDKLVQLAKEGKWVVRLKGGDPSVFGRCAQEAEALRREGVDFEIVPGVTAAVGAASHAGIPITHRDHASAVALVAGHQQHDGTAMDYAALARFPGTLVIYMGVTTAAAWTRELIAAGKPPETPAAIVRRCTLPDQLTIRCRLDEVAARLRQPVPLRPPIVVVIGAVASPELALNWRAARPLAGRRVLVSRPAEPADDLEALLAEEGAEVVRQPAISIAPPDDWQAVDAALDGLAGFDWLVFSSANGVRYFMERLLARGGDMRQLAGLQLAAVGPGTAAALNAYSLRADLQPGEYRAEGLAAALVERAAGARFLLARGSRGREVLAEQLRAVGGLAEPVVVYRSFDVTQPRPEVVRLFAAGAIDWVTVTSSAIARSLHAMFGEQLRRTHLATISPLTSQTLRELGWEPGAEAAESTFRGVVDAIVRAERG